MTHDFYRPGAMARLFADDPSALVPEDRGEEALGVIARQGECVRMADPRSDQSH